MKRPEATGYTMLAIIGGAFVLVGLVNLGLLWFPPRFGNAAWELGTVRQTFDAVPIVGLGWAILAYGIIRHPDARQNGIRTTSIVFAVLALIILLAGLLYATAVPSVLGEAPDQALDALGRSIIKTLAEITVYFVACLLIARLLWSGVEKS